MPRPLVVLEPRADHRSFTRRVFFACLFLAAALIAVNSKSSFIYPINDWGDANAYITVSRMMQSGKVLYRDIFEQKGLYLYWLHIPATLISFPEFHGVYILETMAMTFFLFYAYKTLALFLPFKLILPALPILAFSIASSLAFTHGDSAEELMLPFLAYSLYHLMRWTLDTEGQKMHRAWMTQGLITAIIFWTKYSILSFHLGFALAVIIISIQKKDIRGLFRTILLWFIGFVAGSLPALIYFISQGALLEMAEVYLFSNVINYGEGSEEVLGALLTPRWGTAGILYFGRIFMGFFGSPLMTGLALAGFWGFFFKKRCAEKTLRIAVRCVMISMVLVLISLPIVFNYYFLPLAVLSILGVLYFLRLIETFAAGSMSTRRSIIAMVLIMCLLVPRSLSSSQNAYLLLYGKSDLPQYQFKQLIHQTENPTLLTHVNMDHGFQNVAEITPQHKYFIATNTNVRERAESWRHMVMNGQVDYLISNNEDLAARYPGFPYELIASAAHPFEAEVYIYRLYRLKSLQP